MRFLRHPVLFLLVALSWSAAWAQPRSGIAMHGEPALPEGFPHFSFVNPDAPKGGRLTLGGSGSFDSLNPMIVRGEPAQGVREFAVETLMARSPEEPFTLYGLVAEKVDVPADRSEVTFFLNPEARFSDGHPITADDVIFTWSLLREKGRPNHTSYYKKVDRADRVSDRVVRFVLKAGGDREMPLILGLMPVLAQHATNPDTFDQTSLAPLLGSGPYRITKVDPGHSVVFERDPGWWGRDLPVNRGRFNFDQIRFEYFRDAATLLEAFKTGIIDLRTEDDPSLWAKAFAFPAVTDGRVLKAAVPTGLPAGMTALVFNTRRAVFKDPLVREALIQMFDFEWVNKNLYNGLYKRTQSFFERSTLSSSGRPADDYERKLLAPFPDAVRADIMDGTYRMPENLEPGRNRQNIRKALDLLEKAGYRLDSGRLVDKEGRQLAFEIMAGSLSQPRLMTTFVAELAKLGINASVRVADSAQYQSRLKDYDFDMIQFTWPASLSPGNEQAFRWSSEVADQPGSFNHAGVRNPAADAMIKALLTAESEQDFISSVRALDRVLLSGFYVIPLFHVPAQWVAYWKRLHPPPLTPLFGYSPDSWWVEDTRAEAP